MGNMERVKNRIYMKRLATLIIVLLLSGVVYAQNEDVAPPTFNGGEMRFFRARLAARIKNLAVEKRYPYAELSENVVVAFRVDTVGDISCWRFVDCASQGVDHVDIEPASAATRALVTDAFESLEGEWQPARQGDRKVPYQVRLRLRLPLGRIEQALNPDPLLFMGKDPRTSFYPWLRKHIRYNDRFRNNAGGRVHVRFFIEPDGGITIGEVVETPDEKLTREVLRVIRNSRGKWTSRKVDGVATRTPYEVLVDFAAW